MTKLSKRFLLAPALLAFFALATPAFADDTPEGVAADTAAVQKDNKALDKDNAKLAKHRAKKAKDKAQSNTMGQAGDSVNIGADEAMKSEKGTEKDYDQKTLNGDTTDAAKKSAE